MAIKAFNILLSSAGRRVALLHALEESLANFGIQGKVFCVDQNPALSPACQLSHASYRLPNVKDSSYDSSLRELIDNLDIALVVPTIDPELDKFPTIKNSGSQFLISDQDFVERCTDKNITANLFGEMGVKMPKQFGTWPGYPIFARPTKGSGSIHAQLVESEEQFQWLKKDTRGFIFTEYLDPENFIPYTIDAYYQQGRLIAMVPRKRIEVRAGEISKGVTDKGVIYKSMLPKLENLSGADGPIGIQIFQGKDGEIFGIEVNPRFCGGYPLTHAAGAKFTDWIVRDKFLNETLSFFDEWEHNKTLLRYDADLFF